jgi:hypothetical protein
VGTTLNLKDPDVTGATFDNGVARFCGLNDLGVQAIEQRVLTNRAEAECRPESDRQCDRPGRLEVAPDVVTQQFGARSRWESDRHQ